MFQKLSRHAAALVIFHLTMKLANHYFKLVFLASICQFDRNLLPATPANWSFWSWLAEPSSLVNPEWVQEATRTNANVVVIDCMPPPSYHQHHIPNAFRLSLPKGLKTPNMKSRIARQDFLDAFSQAGITNQTTVVFYDNKKSLLAARAWWVARSFGHPQEKLKVLDGGLHRWMAEGRTVTKEAPKTAGASNYTLLSTREDLDTDLQHVLEMIETCQQEPGTRQFVDGRSPAEFSGEVAGNTKRTGRIPNALNYEWSNSVDPKTFQFKSRREILQALQSKGFDPTRPTTAYCQVGIRGAHVAFVLDQLLRVPNVVLYEGSMVEYLDAPETLRFASLEEVEM